MKRGPTKNAARDRLNMVANGQRGHRAARGLLGARAQRRVGFVPPSGSQLSTPGRWPYADSDQ